MRIESTPIAGFDLLHSPVHPDSRGHFIEVFRRDQLANATGFDFDTAQLNASKSHAGVLRGFHYKLTPPGQAKLVTVLSGAIYDVALDLRAESPTRGLWHGVSLSAGDGRAVLLQHGLAHAFLALAPETVIAYLNDSPFQPELEFAVQPMSVDVDWKGLAAEHKIDQLIVSERDLSAPTLAETLAKSAANR